MEKVLVDMPTERYLDDLLVHGPYFDLAPDGGTGADQACRLEASPGEVHLPTARGLLLGPQDQWSWHHDRAR